MDTSSMDHSSYQSPISTGRIVSNSLNLVDDYYYDSDTNLQYISSSNSIRSNVQQGITATSINHHSIDASTRTIGRNYSADEKEDFMTVTHKKHRKCYNYNTNSEMYVHQQQGRINHRNYSSPPQSNNHRIITNSKLSRHAPERDDPVQSPEISTAATRYAQTRYPFPPFIVRFSAGMVEAKQVAEEISIYFRRQHQTDLDFINYRTSKAKCTNADYDVLLYVKDANSFTHLLDQQKWPSTIGNENYTFLSTPPIPPQLSLIIKNVDFQMDMNEFINDLKAKYPDIKNVIRLKNKFQQDIRFMKMEFTSLDTRNQILATRKVNINYRVYDIEEYIAPASVLICSKCCGNGHFKRQCTQQNETCKTCGQSWPDLKQHVCTNKPKCIHCDGEHLSSVTSCPIVKQYRAALTKRILSMDSKATSYKFKYDPTQFSQLSSTQNSQAWGINGKIMSKLDVMITNMDKMKQYIMNMTKCNEKFDKFMKDKISSDNQVAQDIKLLKNWDKILEPNLIQHEIKLKRFENILTKLVLPVFDELVKALLSHNKDQHGRVLDPDLQSTLEITCTKLKLVLDGKDH